MEIGFLPFALVLVATIFQGTFGLGMKFMLPLRWEAWWLVFSSVAMILFPLTWCLLVVPDLVGIISAAPSEAVMIGLLFGFLWGIGGIMFGKSIPFIGISLTYGIVMGTTSAVGSLIPLFQIENAIKLPAFPFIIAGVLIMLIGVGITAYAGVKREEIVKKSQAENKNFKLGLTIAILSGLLSALLNVGFVNAQPVSQTAEASGIVARNGSLAVWVVVLFGGYVMNAGYAIILLFKNKTWSSFSVPKSGKAYAWAIITGLLWFGALGVYGQGANLMGELGPVIAWPILLGVSLIISNFWAYLNKEWNGAPKPFALLLAGLFILILATVVLGYANGAT